MTTAAELQALERRTYTLDEVAVLLGLSRNSVYVAARADRLPVPVIKIGKRMLVSRTALNGFLQTGDHTELRRRRMTYAAQDLITLVERCPELFERVVPISETDMETLRELAQDADSDAEI